MTNLYYSKLIYYRIAATTLKVKTTTEYNESSIIKHKLMSKFFYNSGCFALIVCILAKTRKITLFIRKQTFSQPIESAQNFTNLSHNLKTSKDLSFLAKCFFVSTNLKFLNEIVL